MKNFIYTIFIVLCYILHETSEQYSRCYLENGATAAHLFVSEDLKVGTTIGVLNVLGDPGFLGDIELRLQELDSPVNFLPHSRNLTLIRPLDKEGIKGPASVYINVICEKKNTLDPGFVIPINIRVTDCNDNAPEFINAPYLLNISEVTVVGTRVLQGIKAIDIDQPGLYSTVQYSILPGYYEDYFVFANPLEGTLILRKSLDYETVNNFSILIRAQDQGYPPLSSITTLNINVIDADDQNPAFFNEQYKINIPLKIKNRKVLQVYPAPIKAIDQDSGINASIKYSIQSGSLPYLILHSETADIVMTRSLEDHEITSSITFIIKATQIDNPDRYALATVTATREDNVKYDSTNGGRLPVRFILKDYYASIPENTPSSSVILKSGVNKIDSNLKFWLVGASEDLKKFSISNSGELILTGNLDYENKIQHTFHIHVTDEQNNDTARVQISVEDVNEWEPRFRYPRYEFHIKTLREGSIIGRLEAADGDKGDRVFLTLRGPDARSFEIRDNGELILRSINKLNGTIARLVAIVTDTGKPSRSTMIPVIVYLPNIGLTSVAVRTLPAWLGSSILLVAIFGAVLGLLGLIILILILYIYKYKKTKSEESVSSVGTEYEEKLPVPLALSPTPQILGVISNRQIPLCSRYKVAPTFETPVLSRNSNIPNANDFMQNMNNLNFFHNKINIHKGSQNSSNISKDLLDSLASTWPVEFISKRVKKLSWDGDKTLDSMEIAIEDETNNSQINHEHPNLTVYF